VGCAAARWGRMLEAWALPEELLAAAEESPYGWPEAVLACMRRERDAGEDTPTLSVVRELIPGGGSLLDVGAGTGRLAVPLAREGYAVTAVEPAGPMLADLTAAAVGLPVEIVEGRWPDAAPSVRHCDLALSAHVVYDVADIGPFVSTLHAAADAVVIECGADHPRTALAPLYRALHGLDRPVGPTVDDLAAVVEEVTGAAPAVVRWEARRPMRFSGRDEALALYRRRLALPAARSAELEKLLGPRLHADGGEWVVDEGARRTATLWWRT
jgi:SAM-dependent methyltransferase